MINIGIIGCSFVGGALKVTYFNPRRKLKPLFFASLHKLLSHKRENLLSSLYSLTLVFF